MEGTLEAKVSDLSKKMYLTNSTVARPIMISWKEKRKKGHW